MVKKNSTVKKIVVNSEVTSTDSDPSPVVRDSGFQKNASGFQTITSAGSPQFRGQPIAVGR
jgi:hypothetical protein